MKKLLINVTGESTRVAVWEQGRLTELYQETETADLVGSVYRGRVVDVLPSMQAAFVDIGLDKNAYLYVDDALPAERQRGAKPNIRELVRGGEERFVQVNKEATGNKAPRVTTQVGLPGRRLVYLPLERHISVSRKLEDERERSRLRQFAERLLHGQEGVIIRTQAAGAGETELAAELAFLRKKWQVAVEESKQKKVPSLVLRDDDLVMRMLRELLADDVDELIVDHPPTYLRVREWVRAVDPSHLNHLVCYQGKRPLFDQFGIETEIEKALQRQVPLKSGGYLLIDRTEAMTVIDVNTGKFTGKGAAQLEETVTRTNLEAAEEIARQLRLRDIGGIIVVDFIDMKLRTNQERVISRLREETEKDRTPARVLGMTQLGLVEMTRKKVRQNLTERLTEDCPACAGSGRVLAVEELLLRFEREAAALTKTQEAEAIVAEVPSRLYKRLSAERTRLEQEMSVRFYFVEYRSLPADAHRILYVGSRGEAERRYQQLEKTVVD